VTKVCLEAVAVDPWLPAWRKFGLLISATLIELLLRKATRVLEIGAPETGVAEVSALKLGALKTGAIEIGEVAELPGVAVTYEDEITVFGPAGSRTV
jgi:hypothetical protein